MISSAADTGFAARLSVRERLARTSDVLAAGVAASLPWSTSAASILIGLWVLFVLPALNWRTVFAALKSPAGGLPVLLWALGSLGMLWAHVSWAEAFAGHDSFHKLLLIPLLLARYRDGGRGEWVLAGYLASCVLLLGASAVLAWWPDPTQGTPGVPVRDYIIQSGEFVLCAFGLLGIAATSWRRRPWLAIACVLLAALFVADVLYIATGRTTLVVMVVLAALFAFWHFGFRGMAGLLAISLLAAGIWLSSPYLRTQVTSVWDEVAQYRTENAITRSGERLEFWRKSLLFIREAPFVGHGTGSIRELFRRSAEGQTGASGQASANPHNQTLTVAVQLGLLGVAALYAMWIAHLLLFRGYSGTAWIGLVLVVQNIVGSLFNSHLFDFVQGWTYVFGVGVLGGMVLRQTAAAAQARAPHLL
jgi:O-antigen ligase